LIMRGPRVFISYRREDCSVHTTLLAENLRHRLGAEVFLDVESIPVGDSFPDFIDRELAASDAVLVLIGDDWLTARNHLGQPRIEDPADWVQLEIRQALERRSPTIPVLVEGATMPRPDQLPDAISPLTHLNAAVLRDESWSHDFERLAAALNGLASPPSFGGRVSRPVQRLMVRPRSASDGAGRARGAEGGALPPRLERRGDRAARDATREIGPRAATDLSAVARGDEWASRTSFRGFGGPGRHGDADLPVPALLCQLDLLRSSGRCWESRRTASSPLRGSSTVRAISVS
jgi:hypothetical protein